MVDQHLRIFGDKIEQIAEGLHQHHGISKCEAMGIVGVVMMDKWGEDRIKLTPAEVKVVEGFVLASCLEDTDYIFQYTKEAEKMDNTAHKFHIGDMVRITSPLYKGDTGSIVAILAKEYLVNIINGAEHSFREDELEKL